ncbi:MAG: hypothetical protein A3H99_09295 [Gallionellales bacterium RIFCSPLOWO2_02_FULL_59_110]|nr:MAG: hypothetical protein A3H99_09295 [Gallionellales bacterium RIFCSPLOWO2_02_FULL_59_110]
MLIAIIGSFATLDHAQRMRETSGRAAKLWMIAGSITLGMSIWGMHFVGMLALHLPVSLAYDLKLTLLSILPAMAAALLGFWVQCCKARVTAGRLMGGGLLMGLGISAMHYTGMAALRMSPPVAYDPPVVMLSVAIAIVASWGALLLMHRGGRIRLPPMLRLTLGAIIMGLAISGMHYTAMLGTHFQSGSICTADTLRVEPGTLAVLVSFGSMLLFGGSFFLILFDRRVARQDARILAGLVLAFSLTLTYQLWNNAQQSAVRIQQIEFDAHVHGITDSINKRMKTYEQVMRGVDGLFSNSPIPISREEFHEYIARLWLKEDFPGIQGIRFVPLVPDAGKDRHVAAMRKENLPAYKIWPEGRRDSYAPSAYVEPFDLRNLQVFGYDMLSDRDHVRPGDSAPGLRRSALERARDSGETAVSGKIRLLFETREDLQNGFVMALPIYKYGAPRSSVAERRANLAGWIVSIFRMGDLMSGIFDVRDTGFDVNVFDGETVAEEMLMYASDRSNLASGKGARFQRSEPIEIAGRKWTVQVRSQPAFEERVEQNQSRIIAAGGIAFSLLLALLTWFLVSSRASALQAAAALERASRKSEMLLHMASDGIQIFDTDGNQLQVNDAFCRMHGYAEEELLTMNLAQLNAQWSKEELLEKIAALQESNPIFETRHRRRDGSIFDVEVSATRMEINGERLVFGAVRDITERKRAEEYLRESEHRLREAQRVAHIGDWDLDLASNVLTWSDEIYRIFEIDPEQFGASYEAFIETVHPDDCELVGNAYAESVRKRAAYDIEHRLLMKDGRVKYVHEQGETYYGEGGEPLRSFGTVHDITERKITEDAIHTIALTTAANVGAAFFQETTNSLCKLLEADCVIVGKLVEGNRMQALGMQLDGKAVEHYEYALPGAPCDIVTQEGYREYPENVRQLFPLDKDLLEMGAESYAGVPVRGRDGKVNGILCAIFRHKLPPQPMRREVMEIIAARAGAEIERQQAEQALRDSEERWSFALEGSGEGVWDWDMQTGKVVYSRRYKEMLGFPADTIWNSLSDWTKRVNPDDLRHAMMDMEKYLDGNSPSYTVVYRMLCKDDSLKWVAARGMVVSRAEDGRPLRMIGTHSDITERFIAQEKLLTLSKAVENSPASVVITGLDGAIEYVNPKFTKVTGYTAQEAIGQNPRILKSGALSPKFYEKMWLTILAGEVWQGEFHNKKKNGEDYFEAATISPIRDDQGSVTHFVAVKEDITERKRTEQQLKKSMAAAEAANRAKSEFLANMSHEIRTPMNAIIGFSHLCLQSGLKPEQQDYLEKVYRSANSLLGIINDILDFSKVEAGKMEVEKTPFRLDDVLRNAADIAGVRATEKGLALHFDKEQGIPQTLVGDPLRLGQVLNNLIGNAVKFTGEGEVAVGVRMESQTPGHVVLGFTVRDTGIGLTQEQIGRLFQSFSQADTSTTRKYGGTGLGLAISARFVELMGGTMWVESTPEQGSVFAFNLPFVCPHEETVPEPGRSGAPSGNGSLAGLSGLRVLLVEDNELNRQLATALLARAGIEACPVCDGAEAIQAAQQQAFDAVLMDVQMPTMDGLEATRRIRENPALAGLPIIAMTANVMVGDRDRCLAAGMNDYIAKPIQHNVLYATLARWTKRTVLLEPAAAAARHVSGIFPGLDPDRAIAGMGGEDTYLTVLEKFIPNQRQAAQSIRDALDAGDRTTAERLAHTLKGIAATVGATALAESAHLLETAIREEETEKYARLFAAAGAELAQAVVSAQEYLQSYAAGAEAVASERVQPVPDLVQLGMLLEQLTAQLKSFDSAAVDTMRRINNQVKDSANMRDFAQLNRYMSDYDYENALAEVQRLAATLNQTRAGDKSDLSAKMESPRNGHEQT